MNEHDLDFIDEINEREANETSYELSKYLGLTFETCKFLIERRNSKNG
jgi:hypothetical protein